MQFKTLNEALKFFSDEDKCHKLFEHMRFPDGVIVCPKCGQRGAYRYATNVRAYKCKSQTCKAKFSIYVGTVLENTKLPLGKWFTALYLISSHKKGISSLMLARYLNIGNKAAWFLLQRLRELLNDNAPAWLINQVEIDETYVGGRLSNMHKDKRDYYKNDNASNKTTVMGLIERDGKAKLQLLGKDSFKDVVRQNVHPDAVLFTDSHSGYKDLNLEFAGHGTVDHSKNQYRDGIAYTNTVEGFFSHLKRCILGTYHSVSSKHLQRYCNEVAFRYNTRKQKDSDRFIELLGNTQGRLKYRDLIKKR